MNREDRQHLSRVADVAERISETHMSVLGDLSHAGFDGLANDIQELKTIIEWKHTQNRMKLEEGPWSAQDIAAAEGPAGLPLVRARNTDPDTSHEAARTVRNQGFVHNLIINLLSTYGPMTDEEIRSAYERHRTNALAGRNALGIIAEGVGHWPSISASGLRTRRSELVRYFGRVRDSGKRRTLPTGRKAIVWELVRDWK